MSKSSRAPIQARTFERSTRQRRDIHAVFDAAERPLSIEEVLSAAKRARSAVSLSTVYRFVRSLVDDGTLHAIEVPGRGAFYELAGKGHHHHFSCFACGRVYELDACARIEGPPLPRGFAEVSHEITVIGVCAACNADRAKKRRTHLH